MYTAAFEKIPKSLKYALYFFTVLRLKIMTVKNTGVFYGHNFYSLNRYDFSAKLSPNKLNESCWCLAQNRAK